MSRFPIVNNLESEIISAITKGNKEKFSGTKAFAALQCFVGLNSVPNGIIGNDSYYAFNFMDEINNHKRRIPPLIKGIEVKTAGTLGAIKKAEVTIQFSSMDELKNNRGFLQIGKTQLLVWGWSKDRAGNPQVITPSVDLAVQAINAQKHLKAVLGKDWDMHAGILTNFSFKINENLTVDATLELSQPSDIPAFLALANKNKKAHVEKTEEETSKPFAEAAQAAALDPDGDKAAYTALLNYTINISDDVFDWTYGNTDTPYIAFGYICKVLSNKSKVLKIGDQRMDIDIDNAIAGGCKRMISVSEHVIIPSKFMPKVKSEETTISGKSVNKLVFTDENEKFAPITLGNNVFEFPHPTSIKKWGVTLNAYEYGYLSNVFLSANFLKEAAKGVDNNREFLEKIINELNVAGAGLWNLGLRDIEDDNGFMVYTIVDYNLTHNIAPPPLIDLTSNNSTITNIDLQADLPKEVAGQAMLGDENTGHDVSPGTNIFRENVGSDPVLGAAKAVNETFEAAQNAKKNTGTEEQAKDNKGLLQQGLELVEDAAGLLASMAGGIIDTVKETFNKMMNAPAESQIKLCKKDYYADGGSDSHFVVFKEAGQVKNLYFKGKKPFKNSLLPVKITFKTLGIGGFVVGKALNTDIVPWLDSSKGFWQITDVKHSVDETKWETEIEIRYRVKY